MDSSPPPSSSPPTLLLKSLLYTPLRVLLPDGRSFVGHFIGVDSSANLILSQAEEFLPRPAGNHTGTSENGHVGTDDGPLVTGAWGGRELGMVMVPSGGIVKIEAQLSDEQWKDVLDGKPKVDYYGSRAGVD
jgi:small nuclear ribonucleoprotein (snRNP)-like protein